MIFKTLIAKRWLHNTLFIWKSKFGVKLKNEEGNILISPANKYGGNIRSYLSDRQKCVVLNPESLSNKGYILFRNGTLFSEYSLEIADIFMISISWNSF